MNVVPKSYRFADVLSIINGRNQKKVEAADGQYPIYGSGGIMGWANDYICPENTVVIGRKGSINNPIYVDRKFWNVDTAFGLVSNRNLLLPRYLFYFCVCFDFEKLNTTVTIPSLTKTNLLQIKISLPPLEEQEKLIHRLDKLCHLIELKKEQLKRLDILAKSRFIEMFGDPASNSMQWPSSAMKEVSVRLSDGPFGSNLKSEHYAESGVRVVRLQNIGVNEFIDKDKAFVSEQHYHVLKKYTCRAGDIVIGTLGEPNLRACLIPQHIMVAINKADCVHYIPDEAILNKTFACYYLNMPSTLTLAAGMVHGQTRARISSGQIAKLPIILPPISLQNEFAAFIEELDKSKFSISRQQKMIDSCQRGIILHLTGRL